MADDVRYSTRPPAGNFAAAPAPLTQRVVSPVPLFFSEGNATPAPRRRPSTQEPAGRPSDAGIRQDRSTSTGNNRDLKVLALNYFCDSKGRTMKKICEDFGLAGVYKNLKKFVSRDSVLKRVNLELKRGEIYHRSDALTRINALITERVDTSRVGAPDVGVECAGLKNEHVDRYGNVNP